MISVDHWAADPESVARWPRSVCPRGPVVPWSRLAPVWPHASSPALLRLGVPGSRIGGPVAPFGVLAWSRGPVVPCGFSLSLALSLFAVWGPRSGIIGWWGRETAVVVCEHVIASPSVVWSLGAGPVLRARCRV